MSAPDSIAALLGRLTDNVHLRTAEEAEAERVESARAEIARDARTLRGQLEPTLPAEQYARLVPDRRLRALAAKYSVERGSVLIIGPADTGKTITLRRVARRLLAEAWRAGATEAPIIGGLWCSAIELAASIRETRMGSVCEAMRAAQRAPLLFLDELGQEVHDQRWLLQLLDARYMPRHRPTLTTSGLTKHQLIERYGDGAYRRLFQPVGTVVDLYGGCG
jgi:DNA replication protein DnaC